VVYQGPSDIQAQMIAETWKVLTQHCNKGPQATKHK